MFFIIIFFKYLINIDKISLVKPTIKDSKFINLDIYYKLLNKKNKYKSFKISFRDSVLLLPDSLSNLGF